MSWGHITAKTHRVSAWKHNSECCQFVSGSLWHEQGWYVAQVSITSWAKRFCPCFICFCPKWVVVVCSWKCNTAETLCLLQGCCQHSGFSGFNLYTCIFCLIIVNLNTWQYRVQQQYQRLTDKGTVAFCFEPVSSATLNIQVFCRCLW